MKFGSVCSGIEAASVAWHPLGWKAAWLSEIEPFPSAVLAHHYPDVPNLGDMTTLPERILSGEVQAPDVFCGGTPCQAFSVAGLRNSLDDARGNLSLTFVGIANAIDHVRSVRGEPASIVFWENVPGVLSTKDNAFGCFLGALAGEDDPVTCPDGKWPTAGVVVGQKRAVAWRVLDAQYFGVAQRRRRVFVVASARDDFDPAAVLFEFNGVRRDTAPSREARQETAASARAGVEFGGMSPVAGTLTANTGGMTRPAGNANELDFCVPVAQPLGFSGRGDGSDALEGITPTMRSLAQGTDGHQSGSAGLAVAQPIAIQDVRPIEKMQNGRGWNDDGTAYTVDTHATQGVAQPIGIFQDSEYGVAKYDSAGTLRAGRIPEHQMVMQPMPINTMVALRHEALGEGTGFGIGAAGDPAYTLTKGHSHAVAHPVGFDAYNNDVTGDVSKTIDTGQDYHHVPNVMVSQPVVAPTLTASNDPSRSPQSTEVTNQVASVYEASMAVRRLTPVECERLQGFPDGYTNIPWRKKPESPDGPRYKALGNSWAVPVVAWLGKRINEAVK